MYFGVKGWWGCKIHVGELNHVVEHLNVSSLHLKRVVRHSRNGTMISVPNMDFQRTLSIKYLLERIAVHSRDEPFIMRELLYSFRWLWVAWFLSNAHQRIRHASLPVIGSSWTQHSATIAETNSNLQITEAWACAKKNNRNGVIYNIIDGSTNVNMISIFEIQYLNILRLENYLQKKKN